MPCCSPGQPSSEAVRMAGRLRPAGSVSLREGVCRTLHVVPSLLPLLQAAAAGHMGDLGAGSVRHVLLPHH